MSLVRRPVRGLVRGNVRGLVAGGGDAEFRLSSASVAADGVTWTLNFNRAANQGTGWNVLDFTASGTTTGAIGLVYVSGDGSSVWTMTGSPAAVSGETLTLNWAGTVDGIEDGEGNDLAAFTGKSVTNNVPSAGGDTYLRPGGVDSYLRPGGVDTYRRP